MIFFSEKNKTCLGWLLLATLTSLLLVSMPSLAANLLIQIDSPGRTGIIEFQVYNTANGFVTQSNPFKVKRQALDDSGSYKISDLPAATYALLVYLDENNNGQLDRNFIGIPLEPVGFSNQYVPRGSPSFIKASFELGHDENLRLDISLKKPLGKSAQISIGPGAILRSNPYGDDNDSDSRFIPAITYIGERLQILGPRFQWGLTGSGKLRLALAGQYRFAAYEEGDSPLLTGMHDRDSTLMAGLALQIELPAAIDLKLSHQLDTLDRIGGTISAIHLSKKLQYGSLTLTPKMGFKHFASSLSNYEYGVTELEATAERPAYSPGSTTNTEAGVRLFIELSRDWLLLADINIEQFDDAITDSPIIEKDSVVKGFAAISYVF